MKKPIIGITLDEEKSKPIQNTLGMLQEKLFRIYRLAGGTLFSLTQMKI